MSKNESARNVGKNGIIYSVGSVMSSAIYFLFIPIFMRFFDVDEYGVYTLIVFCGSLAGTVFYLGVTSALPRSYYDYPPGEKRKSCFSTTLAMLVFGASSQIFLAFIFSKNISILLFDSDKYEYEIILGFISSAITFINFSFLTYLRLEGKALEFLFYSVISLLMALGFVCFFVIFRLDGIQGALLGNVLAQVLMLILFLGFMGPSMLTIKLMSHEISIQLKFGFFAIMSSLAGMSILWVDQLFVNEYLTLHDLGIYALSVKISSVMSVVFVAPFVQVFNPIIMEHRTSADIDTIFVKSVRYFFGFGIFILLFSSIFFQEVLVFIDRGNKFHESIIYIPFLMAGILLYGLNNIVSAGCFFERKVVKVFWCYVVIAVFNIAANFVLIPEFGLNGAVTSSFVTYALSPFLIYFYSKRYYSFPMEISPVLLLFAAFFSVYMFDWFVIKDLTIYPRFIFRSAVIFLFGYLLFRYYLKINIPMIKKVFN